MIITKRIITYTTLEIKVLGTTVDFFLKSFKIYKIFFLFFGF